MMTKQDNRDERTAETHDAIVVGAGQAGLAISWHLKRSGVDHVVLERGRVAETWRSRRWDSFRLLIPNQMCRLPGFAYEGPDPRGFMPKDEIVHFFEEYAASFRPPVREGVDVIGARRVRDRGWHLTTTAGALEAEAVVVATGAYQVPYMPPLSFSLPPRLLQIHTDSYRNPDQLPAGGVLVVGSGSSGGQIAAELARAGRDVYMATGRCHWIRRRYRGRDIADWIDAINFFAQPVESLPHPSLRKEALPVLEGNTTGADLTLPSLEAEGVTLTGRLAGVSGSLVMFEGDLRETYADADAFLTMVLGRIDDHIEAQGIAAPVDAPVVASVPPQKVPSVLDLDALGIGTVIWATGYRFDFSWIEGVPVDEQGYPVHHAGVSVLPGLYFVGLPWLTTRGSGAIPYVGRDAERIAEHVAGSLSDRTAPVLPVAEPIA